MKEVKDDRKTRYTRKALRDSLMELMKQKPFAKITIKEICETADINRTTFYTHYTDQDDLLRDIEDETLTWVKTSIQPIIADMNSNETMKILESIFQYFKDNKERFEVMMSEHSDKNFQQKLIITIYTQCNIVPEPLSSTHPATRELRIIFVVNGIIGLIQHWLMSGFLHTPRELAEITFTMARQLL